MSKEIKMKSIRISSGGDHPSDIMPTGSEISFAKKLSSFKDKKIESLRVDENFQKMGFSSSDGSFTKTFALDSMPEIAGIRIAISKPTGFWLWIYDIYIEEFKEPA